MSCHNISKKTDHQGKWFSEYAKKFDDRHHRNRNFQPHWYLWPKYIFPISLCPIKVSQEKCNQCQHHGNSNVTRYISTAGKYRNQPHQIIRQYEEKGSQQKRSIPFVVFSYTSLYHIVIYRHDSSFYHTYPTFWCAILNGMFFIPTYTTHHYNKQYRTIYKKSQYVFCNGDIQRSDFFASSILFYYFPIVCTSVGYI